jgi:hypothetical protein
MHIFFNKELPTNHFPKHSLGASHGDKSSKMFVKNIPHQECLVNEQYAEEWEVFK